MAPPSGASSSPVEAPSRSRAGELPLSGMSQTVLCWVLASDLGMAVRVGLGGVSEPTVLNFRSIGITYEA